MHHFFPNDEIKNFEQKLSELYQKKSKTIHHSMNGIMEYYNARIDNDKLISVGFDYGKCSYPRKLLREIGFFQTNIWSAIHGFFICFDESLPLDKEDSDLLFKIDRKFYSKMGS